MTARWSSLPARPTTGAGTTPAPGPTRRFRIPWPGRRLREEIQHLEAVVAALRVELEAARREAEYQRAEKHRMAEESAWWRRQAWDLQAHIPTGHLEGRARVELHRDGTRRAPCTSYEEVTA